MTRDRLLNICLVVVTISAVATSGAALYRTFIAPRAAAGVGARPEPRPVSDWRTYAGTGWRLGPASAAATIVMFTDFQCPFCARQQADLARLRRAYPQDVSIVYRQYPLPFHAHARAAALASECAAAQGRFATFVDSTFANQHEVGRWPWERFAALAGVTDLASFDRCMESPEAAQAVERDVAAGKHLGLTGTPSLLLNGTLYAGGLPYDTLVAFVKRPLLAGR